MARASHASDGSTRGRFRLGDQPCRSILRGFLLFAHMTGAARTTSENPLTPSGSRVMPGAVAGTWRPPALVIGMGCLITLIAFGPRTTLGFFLTPLSSAK